MIMNSQSYMYMYMTFYMYTVHTIIHENFVVRIFCLHEVTKSFYAEYFTCTNLYSKYNNTCNYYGIYALEVDENIIT